MSSILEIRIGKFFVALVWVLVTMGTQASARLPDAPAQQGTDTLPGFPPRPLRYHPEGSDFVITNGTKKFNRALYGGHTAFRVETGDVPIFALYEPGIAGTLKLGIRTPGGDKWLEALDTVEARYRAGTMIYRLKDALLGSAVLSIQVLATYGREGMLIRAEVHGRVPGLKLIAVYGGASGQHPSRNGDLGADPPEIFALTPAHARGNRITLSKGGFRLRYEDKKQIRTVSGVLPPRGELRISDASRLTTPAKGSRAPASVDTPVAFSETAFQTTSPIYFAVFTADSSLPDYGDLPGLFQRTESERQALARRVRVETPDPFINTLGGTLVVAADAIWQSPAYLHGAVAWRMWLNGWRGAYAASDLGWHDRAHTLFSAYNQMQLRSPDTTIVDPDTSRHLARQVEKQGVGIYNAGYITRYPKGKIRVNHYDMNLVYIDEMLRNFQWTGDTAFLRSCWPVLVRHLAWEKRNFDQDGNHLYDAYAAIWASDALQYSGGDVTHSSAYNYFSNLLAGRIATILGIRGTPYRDNAAQIRHAMDAILWMPRRGWYAEYRDRRGLGGLHPSAGLWTIYHAIDSKVPDPLQAYQCLRYIDLHIPHIPIHSPDLKGDYHLLSSSDWMPYTWSVNNVAMAEVMHTALAYWEGDRSERAFNLFKSMVLESMYLGSSPGNFEQLSSYDRFRGELYRDFADPIGITSRALVEGLFGIRPDALAGRLEISPGFPEAWDHASIHLPDIDYQFRRDAREDTYVIRPRFPRTMRLLLRLQARATDVRVAVNGKRVAWRNDTTAVGRPRILVNLPPDTAYRIRVTWQGNSPVTPQADPVMIAGNTFQLNTPPGARLLRVKDPQDVFSRVSVAGHGLRATVSADTGTHSFFVQFAQGKLSWWAPVNTEIRPAWQIVSAGRDAGGIRVVIRNNSTGSLSGNFRLTTGAMARNMSLRIAPGSSSPELRLPADSLFQGTNRIRVSHRGISRELLVTDWAIRSPAYREARMISLTPYFNDQVTRIFRNRYLSPRPQVPTLQLPWQGIGNWCSPLVDPQIDDSGLRRLAGSRNRFTLPGGIPFLTPGTADADSLNILFTSRWARYPRKRQIPLTGKASHAYLLMAGSTNPMQSRIVNGKVTIRYADGSADSLLLINPGTWWPIEEDYRYDAYAFYEQTPVPYRVHLKTGEITRNFNQYKSIKGLTALGIPGGAATVVDMPLDGRKALRSLQLETEAGDVVIGLMSVTLIKNNP